MTLNLVPNHIEDEALKKWLQFLANNSHYSFLTSSVVNNAPSLAANTTTLLPLLIKGVEVTDLIIVNTSDSLPDGIVLGNIVPLKDRIDIYLGNLTASTVVLPAVTFNILLFK